MECAGAEVSQFLTYRGRRRARRDGGIARDHSVVQSATCGVRFGYRDQKNPEA